MKFTEQQPEIFGQIVNGKVIPDPSFVMEAQNARQEAKMAQDEVKAVEDSKTTPEGAQKPVDVEKIIDARIEEATNAIREEVGGVVEQVTAERENEKKDSEKERKTFEKELAKKDKLIASLEKKLGKKDMETKGLLERIKNALLDG